jgi:SAM-dependent methyltransferase
MANKAAQSYWDGSYDGVSPFISGEKDAVREWILRHVPEAREGDACLEAGCYPGRYLAALGEIGYELHGIDMTPRVEELPGFFREQGYRTGEFVCGDFLTYSPGRKYQVVLSLGFIEHFTDWESVLESHVRLVDDGGLLILETPNFLGGFQNWLHRTFDEENYRRHHVPAMDVNAWATRLEASQFEILHAGYFGGWQYWVEWNKRPFLKKAALRALRLLSIPLKMILPNESRFYAPYGGLVARRK